MGYVYRIFIEFLKCFFDLVYRTAANCANLKVADCFINYFDNSVLKYAEIQSFIHTKLGDFAFVMVFENENVNFTFNLSELNETNSLFQKFFNFFQRTTNYELVLIKLVQDKCIYFPYRNRILLTPCVDLDQHD